MSNSKSAVAYADVKELLDRALLGKGFLKACETKGQARHFVSRANSFRVLDRKQNETLYPLGHTLHGCSIYDTLLIRIRDTTVQIVPIALDSSSITEIDSLGPYNIDNPPKPH